MKQLITKTYFYDTKKHLSTYNHLNCIYAWFGFLISALFYCLKIIYIFLLYCLSSIELVGVTFVRTLPYI